MKRKSKQVKPTNTGTPVLAQVHLQYVQINVPTEMISATVEALSHLILSDYYASKEPLTEGDGYDVF